jgi:hypothetical protein
MQLADYCSGRSLAPLAQHPVWKGLHCYWNTADAQEGAPSFTERIKETLGFKTAARVPEVQAQSLIWKSDIQCLIWKSDIQCLIWKFDFQSLIWKSDFRA